jgi:hypothetical protein
VGVLRIAGRVFTILALCSAIGLHWLALQSVAWTTMLIDHAKSAPLRAAIAQTFDGAHPCSLCHFVNRGTSSDKKSNAQSPAPKIDIICVARAIRLLPAFIPLEYSVADFSSFERRPSPPVPPPRLAS